MTVNLTICINPNLFCLEEAGSTDCLCYFFLGIISFYSLFPPIFTLNAAIWCSVLVCYPLCRGNTPHLVAKWAKPGGKSQVCPCEPLLSNRVCVCGGQLWRGTLPEDLGSVTSSSSASPPLGLAGPMPLKSLWVNQKYAANHHRYPMALVDPLLPFPFSIE